MLTPVPRHSPAGRRISHRVAALLLPLALLAACDEPPEREEVVRPIRAVRIVDTEALSGRSFPCRAEAVQEVNIAFEVAGRLIERPIDVGSELEAGEKLARLDPRDFENALAQAEARRTRAEALRDRMTRAAASGAVSEQDLTDAEAEFEGASAEVAIRAKALEDSELRAPFDGVIVATYVENFQNVQAKQPVARLLDISRIECVVNIPENMISMAPYVRDIEVTFDAFPDRPIPAVITEIGREASEVTRTFPVTLVMDQPEEIEILPGMAGRSRGQVVLPDLDPETGYDVPMSAVFSDDGERSLVWVIDEATRTVSKREIRELGSSRLGVRIGGVEQDELIAVTAVHFLREGQQVRLPELERGQ